MSVLEAVGGLVVLIVIVGGGLVCCGRTGRAVS